MRGLIHAIEGTFEDAEEFREVGFLCPTPPPLRYKCATILFPILFLKYKNTLDALFLVSKIVPDKTYNTNFSKVLPLNQK